MTQYNQLKSFYEISVWIWGIGECVFSFVHRPWGYELRAITGHLTCHEERAHQRIKPIQRDKQNQEMEWYVDSILTMLSEP